ncbi:Uncharacterized protein APZ42_027994 [Daphnia magna]|uniref:Uncharacterized protein n=1 Tax=Daphnia magna TaxID=35525 RepID=A0A164QWZ0_9CRUS|nr:Uncharacterized protein APZ42_027994 [Daphnia magna]
MWTLICTARLIWNVAAFIWGTHFTRKDGKPSGWLQEDIGTVYPLFPYRVSSTLLDVSWGGRYSRRM